MSYPEYNELAAALDRAARRFDGAPAAALAFAAALLRDEAASAARLLAALPVVDLLSIAALKLDAEAATGDERAARAAAHANAAGAIYVGE